jgi:hypothetical protein
MVEVPGPLVLNVPHAPVAVLPQVTDHLTPALAESLVTVTASDAVALTIRDEGAAEEKETEIGSGGVVFVAEEPPQATSAAQMLTRMNSKIQWRKGIVPPFR